MFSDDKNNDYYSICENISEEFGKKLLRLFDSYSKLNVSSL